MKTKLKRKEKQPNSEKRLLWLNELINNKKTFTLIILGIFAFGMLFTNYAVNIIYQLPTFMDELSMPEETRTVTFSILQAFDFSKDFIPFYALLAILLAALTMKLVYSIHISYADLNIGQKGSESWATMDEIKQQYKEVPERDGRYPGRGGLIVAWENDKLYIDDSPVNNLGIGITRSGKGETVIKPMIDTYSRAEEQPSLIVADPKLELASSSIPELEKRGYECHILNLIDPEFSMGFNPLTMIVEAYKERRFDTAQLLCSTFCYSIFNPGDSDGDSAYWANNSTYLLSAVILAHTEDMLAADREANEKARYEYFLTHGTHDGFVETHENEKKINMYSVYNIINNLAKQQYDDGYSELDNYFNNRDEYDPARVIFGSISVAGSTKTKGSIYSNTLSKLTIFTYDNIAKMTATSSIDLMDVGWGTKPMAIFIGIPDYDKSNHFIVSVFIKQLYFILAKLASHSPSGGCYREVVFHLDEFGNIPAIEGMENIITVCLGRNIRFNLFIQSYSQLDQLYGDNAKTIIGNCGNQLYIMTNDLDTAEHFSGLIGNKTITNVSRTGDRFSLKKQITEMYEERPLIDKNELMQLLPGECVIKRVMKRQDLKGNKIKPKPICNMGDHAYKFCHQYLGDQFPSDVFLYETADTLKVIEKINQIRQSKGQPPFGRNEIKFYQGEIESTDSINLIDVSWSANNYLEQADMNNTPLSELLTQPDLLHIATLLSLNEKDQGDLINGEIKTGDILYEVRRQKECELLTYKDYYDILSMIQPEGWQKGE